jgi:hypothetical protein
MFEAFVLICMIGLPELPTNCEEVQDVRGPYVTEKLCKARIAEILEDLPKYRPYSYPKGYRCDPSPSPKTKST